MGTIADKLAYTKQAREEIQAAIIAKGVECPGDAPFCAFDEYIGQIQGGGGGSAEYVAPTNNSINCWTSSDGNSIADGTIANHYYVCRTLNQFTPGALTWEFQAKFKVNADNAYYRTLVGPSNNWWVLPSLELHSAGRIIARISTNGSSWEQQVEIAGKISFGAWYWIKFGYTCSYYYVSLSTDGDTFEEIGRINYSLPCYQSAANSYFMIGGSNNASDHLFTMDGGSIDLSETYIKIDNKIWWAALNKDANEEDNSIVISTPVTVNNTNNHWVSKYGNTIATGYTDTRHYYLCQSLAPFKPENLPWEFQTKIKISDSSSSGAILGALEDFYDLPTIELQKTLFWAGISTNGSTWEKTFKTETDITIDTWYWLKYGYTGTYYYILLSTDGKNFIEYARLDYDLPCYQEANDYFTIGGVRDSSGHHFCKNGAEMDLSETYIKINDELWWSVF